MPFALVILIWGVFSVVVYFLAQFDPRGTDSGTDSGGLRVFLLVILWWVGSYGLMLFT